MSWVIVFCSFLGLFCLLVGILAGGTLERRSTARGRVSRRERRELAGQAEDRAAARAAAQFRAMRPPELHHERRTSTAAFLDLPGSVFAAAMTGAAGQAHEAWLAHEETALALTRPETDEEFTARMHADVDRFIAEVVHGGQQ